MAGVEDESLSYHQCVWAQCVCVMVGEKAPFPLGATEGSRVGEDVATAALKVEVCNGGQRG